MDVLIRYGFSIEEIKNIIDTNDAINDIDDDEIYGLIDVLIHIGCNLEHIKNIFISNPFFLTRNIDEVKRLMAKFLDMGLVNLEILFDSNPYLLNVSYKEIDDIYNNKLKEGMSREEINDYFYFNSDEIV